VSAAESGLLRDIQRLLPAPLEHITVQGFKATPVEPSTHKPARTIARPRHGGFFRSQRSTGQKAGHRRMRESQGRSWR
jgi:hypothetical protein